MEEKQKSASIMGRFFVITVCLTYKKVIA